MERQLPQNIGLDGTLLCSHKTLKADARLS